MNARQKKIFLNLAFVKKRQLIIGSKPRQALYILVQM